MAVKTANRTMPDLEGITATLRARLLELRRRYGIVYLGVFGSYVLGKQRPGSDMDILVEPRSGLKPWATSAKPA